MKKEFLKPEAEKVEFGVIDILCSSDECPTKKCVMDCKGFTPCGQEAGIDPSTFEYVQ